MSVEKTQRFGTLTLGPVLICIVLVALILALFVQGRRIAALEARLQQNNRVKVQETNTLIRMNMEVNKRFDHIEKRIDSLGKRP